MRRQRRGDGERERGDDAAGDERDGELVGADDVGVGERVDERVGERGRDAGDDRGADDGVGPDRPWRLLSEGATKIAYAPAVCVIGERILVLCAVQQVRHSPIQQTLGEPWDGRHRTEPAGPSVSDPLQGWPVAAPPAPGYAPYGEIRELGGWLCDGPAIAQCTPFHGYQDVVGRGGDNAYYHARGGIQIARDAWRQIPGGVFSSAPSIVHRDPRYVLDTSRVPSDVQYLEVVGRGLDNAVYHATLKGDAWTSWTQIPGLRTQFAPAIASLSWNELYAFAVGLDGRLYSAFRRDEAGPWTSWRRYDDGPLCTSGPAVARIAAPL